MADAMDKDGWYFSPTDFEPFSAKGKRVHLHDLYLASEPSCTCEVTSPVLWDKKTGKIVTNDNETIMRIFNNWSTYNDSLDLYPPSLRGQIQEKNELIETNVNNGVYRIGFLSSDQKSRVEGLKALFRTLDGLEATLAKQRYLNGDQITETDWRLFTTLVRFDIAYFGALRCNRKRIADYPHLQHYLMELYQVPGVAGTVSMKHYLTYYGVSLRMNFSFAKVSSLMTSVYDMINADKVLKQPHLRVKRVYPDDGMDSGVGYVLMKFNLCMQMLALLAALMYMIDEDKLHSAIAFVTRLWKPQIDLPTDW
jgi:glutathionyl-hydroquinone reductase